MNSNSAAVRAGTGAVAGLTATMVLHPLRKATEEKLPQLRPPMREDPGKFMVEQAKRALPENARAKVPQPLEKATIKSLVSVNTSTAVPSGMRPNGACARCGCGIGR